jgi:hypothetical protein
VSGQPYLPPEEARGCAYCFDPESHLLREALTAPAPANDTPLTRDALAEDLRFLHALMQKQYAGYPDLLQHPAFDIQDFFSSWLDRVRRSAQSEPGATISFHDGVVEPLIELRRVLPDNHFFVGTDAPLRVDPRLVFHELQAPRPDGFEPDRYGLDALDGALPATFREAPLLRADGSRAHVVTLSAAGTAEALLLGGGTSAIRLVRRPDVPRPAIRPPAVPAYEWRAVGDTTVITLRAFRDGPAVREQLRRFASDYPAHAQRPKILFDLRGNGGGSLEYIDRWIAQAVHGTWRTYPRLEIVGALWPCSEWNFVVERQILEGQVDSPAARRERDQVRATWPRHRPAHSSYLLPDTHEGHASEPYSGHVFVLVDRHAGSSGELAAVQLKRALGALVIGERTTGVMQYGQIRRFVLPHTALLCQLPTRRFFFDEQVESVGWPVDVYLEDVTADAGTMVPRLDSLETPGRPER